MYAIMNGRLKSGIMADFAIALHKTFHDRDGQIRAMKVLPLIEITKHLTEIKCSVTKLSKLPVDNL